jgi:sugar lactone lactonase YvrE
MVVGVFLASVSAEAQVGQITTMAGGLAGDGGPIADASLLAPHDLAFDRDGNLFFTDRGYSVIRRVDAKTGVVTRVAGSGISGYGGDGGPATEARMGQPFGISLDAEGNIYFADSFNMRIRFVNRTDHPVTVSGVTVVPGTIATLAGNGYHTGGIDGPGGDQADEMGDHGPALLATLGFPRSVLLEPNGRFPGNIFIPDIHNMRIRRVDGRTGIITTVAGNGECYDPTPDGGFGPNCVADNGDGGPATQAAIDWPGYIAFDAAGNLFISEGVGALRRVDARTGFISTIGGVWPPDEYSGDGGPASAAHFAYNMKGMTFDAAGNFLFADEENQVVRRLAAIGGEIRPSSTVSTVAGTGFEMPMFGGGRYSRAQDGLRPTEVDLNAPTGLALRQGRLFVAEMENGVLRVVDAGGDGRIDGDASERLSYVAGGEGIKRPGSVAVDAAGNAYVGEFFHARIRKADPSGQITTLVGTEVPSFSIAGMSPAPGDNGPVRDATIGVPSTVRIDRDGNMWFLDSYADRGTTSLRRIRATRNKSKAPVLGPASRIDKIAELDFAGSAMAVGADSVYVTDPEHNRIWEVRIRDGQVLPFAGTGERTPSVDDCSGTTAEDRGDGGPAQSATMTFPLGVALDASEAGSSSATPATTSCASSIWRPASSTRSPTSTASSAPRSSTWSWMATASCTPSAARSGAKGPRSSASISSRSPRSQSSSPATTSSTVAASPAMARRPRSTSTARRSTSGPTAWSTSPSGRRSGSADWFFPPSLDARYRRGRLPKVFSFVRAMSLSSLAQSRARRGAAPRAFLGPILRAAGELALQDIAAAAAA